MPQIRFRPGGAHDAPTGCENKEKIKWLYEGETATLGLDQMGNEMKKVGNRWARYWVKCRMRNRKYGMTVIGGNVKPHDRCHSAYYRIDITTGRVVKCRPAMCKMQTMKQEYVFDPAHTL